MNLEELMVDSKAAWMDYPGCDGFEIQVANLSRKELIAMRKKCTTSKWDRKNRIMDETLDEEKFVKLFKNKRQKPAYLKDANIMHLEMSLVNKVGLNVEIKNKKNNNGKITFEYKDLDQLNRIIDIIKSNY